MNKRTVVLCSITSVLLIALGSFLWIRYNESTWTSIIFFGILVGYIATQGLSDYLRRRSDNWNRRLHYIRNLLLLVGALTYAACLAMTHIEAAYAMKFFVMSVGFFFAFLGLYSSERLQE